jgi:tetratricopeptide (TPR) repeat protein
MRGALLLIVVAVTAAQANPARRDKAQVAKPDRAQPARPDRTQQTRAAQVAKELQAGAGAYRLGKYEVARAHLERARAVDDTLAAPHRFLAEVAQAQDRWDDCIASARRALELEPESSELAHTRKIHDGCRASAGRAPYRGELTDGAAIAVTTNVTAVTVRINRLSYGGTPLAPRPILPGPLVVDLDKYGYQPCTLRITALPGIVTDVIVTLQPEYPRPRGSELNRVLDFGHNRWLTFARATCGRTP